TYQSLLESPRELCSSSGGAGVCRQRSGTIRFSSLISRAMGARLTLGKRIKNQTIRHNMCRVFHETLITNLPGLRVNTALSQQYADNGKCRQIIEIVGMRDCFCRTIFDPPLDKGEGTSPFSLGRKLTKAFMTIRSDLASCCICKAKRRLPCR